MYIYVVNIFYLLVLNKRWKISSKKRNNDEGDDGETDGITQGDRVTDGQGDIEAGKERDSKRLCDDEEKQEGGDGQRNKRRGKKGATAQPKGIGSIAVAYEGNMYALYIYQ